MHGDERARPWDRCLGDDHIRESPEDGTWLLNGRKMWITNGVIDDGSTPADVCMVYAKTGQDDDGRQQITTFIVERGMEGYSVGQKILDKLGMRASNTADLVFDDVRIPSENVVGKPGESTVHMMRNLEIERIALAAMAVGISRRCLSIMNQYASERRPSGGGSGISARSRGT